MNLYELGQIGSFMNKIWFIGILLIGLIFISSCATQPKQTVCNKPYILVGNDCCLDKDDNSICDKDEQQKIETPEVKETPKTETKEVKEQKPTYTIGEVQADINKVLRGDIFKYVILAKSDSSTSDFDFYTDNIKTATLLAKRGTINYRRVLEKFRITTFDIKNEDKYISNKDDLIKFVNSNIPLLSSYLNIRKAEVIQQAKDGDIHRLIEERQKTGTKLTFRNITLKETKIYDEVTNLDTLQDKVVEILDISLEDYELWYDKRQGLPIKFDLNGISYLQAYNVQCSPNLLITLYASNYEGRMDEANINNHVDNERKEMLREAQAIIDMCAKRYEFTYIRAR